MCDPQQQRIERTSVLSVSPKSGRRQSVAVGRVAKVGRALRVQVRACWVQA